MSASLIFAVIRYTSQLRPNDAAILEVGHQVTLDMVIPPDQEEFTITGAQLPSTS